MIRGNPCLAPWKGPAQQPAHSQEMNDMTKAAQVLPHYSYCPPFGIHWNSDISQLRSAEGAFYARKIQPVFGIADIIWVNNSYAGPFFGFAFSRARTREA
jgi:hypothetical protein